MTARASLPPARYDLSQRLSAEQLELLLANALVAGTMDAAPEPDRPPEPAATPASDRETALRLSRLGGLRGPTARHPGSPLACCLEELSAELHAGRIGAISAILSAYQFGRATADDTRPQPAGKG